MKSNTCTRNKQVFGEYLEFMRHGNSDLSSFWMSYTDLVDILPGLIRASREGDWLLHLKSISDMISWCFAYDKHSTCQYSMHRCRGCILITQMYMTTLCTEVFQRSLDAAIHLEKFQWIRPPKKL